MKVDDKVKIVADEDRLKELDIDDLSVMRKIGFITGIRKPFSDAIYEVNIDEITWECYERDLELVKLDEGLEVKDTKQYGHPRFYETLKAMADLHSRKNHDYAGTSDPLKNLRACERLELSPFLGVMVRLQDKWSRLEEFVKSGKLMVKGESVKDTLMDNAVYSILAIILYEEQEKVDRTAQLEEDTDVAG